MLAGGHPLHKDHLFSHKVAGGRSTSQQRSLLAGSTNRFRPSVGRDWIDANQCIPPSLHQYFIQSVGNKVDVIHDHEILSACLV
jgi:hypothetical protein